MQVKRGKSGGNRRGAFGREKAGSFVSSASRERGKKTGEELRLGRNRTKKQKKGFWGEK